MSRPRLIVWLVALCLLGLLGSYVYSHLEWEKTGRRSGMSGEARSNPYHAGLLMMESLGYPTRQLADTGEIKGLSPQTTLLLDHNKALDKPSQARLLAWVRSGGHLVLNLGFERNPALLGELGIHTVGTLFDPLPSENIDPADSPETLEAKRRRFKFSYALKIEGEELRAGLSRFKVFQRTGEMEWSADLQVWPALATDEEEDDAEDEDPAERKLVTKASDSDDDTEPETVFAFGRFALGEGHVTVGRLDILSNWHVHEFDHARLFVRLLSLPDGIRPIAVMPTPKSPDLLTWLTRHAPEALLGALLLVLASLWHFAPRFGPLRPDPEPMRPGLREHLAACGNFLLRTRSYEALIAPLREDTLRQLEHLYNRHPDFNRLSDLAAQLSGVDRAEIIRALSPAPDSHHEFLRRSQILALLRTHCHRLRQPASASGTLP